MADQDFQVDFATSVFDTTYRCNDTCKFCFNQKKINRAPDMNVDEVKKNYAHVLKERNIKQVILSGGEPMLHPQFWEIMDFFCNETDTVISLNTNSLPLADAATATRLTNLFKTAKNPKRYFSLSLSTIDHWPVETPIEKMKLTGVQTALQVALDTDTQVLVIITITKTNYHTLPQVAQFLAIEAKKYAQQHRDFIVSVRGLYLGDFMTPEQKADTVPTSFEQISPYVEEALHILLRAKNIRIRLFSLPLCYFKTWRHLPDLLQQLAPSSHEERMKVSHEQQEGSIKSRLFHGDVWRTREPECRSCALEPLCDKIQQEFITSYGYPPLQHF